MDEMIKRLMDKLSAANERREATVTARKALLDTAEAEKRDALSEDEDVQFRAKTAAIAAIDVEIAETEARVAELEAEKEATVKAQAAAARAKAYQPGVGGAQVTKEELTYRKGNGSSYIADLTRALILHDPEAGERMARHAREVRDAPEFQEFRVAANLSRTDGNGGFFVPPAWLMSQWIELARAGRPTADLIGSQALPPGTDSINIPKVATGTAADIQTADNAAVAETAFTDTSISVPVKTIAGQQTMAIQLIDQSPLNFDEIIFRDLLADYATKSDVQVLSGSNAGNQVKGILTTTGTKTANVTAVTGIGVYSAVANVVQQVHTSRFLSPQVLVMHPRRWAWLQVQVDANGRPLVLPRANSAVNAVGHVNTLAAQGPVGDMMGLPIYLDPSIPTTLQNNGTAGGTEDRILVLRPDDLLFYESSIRSRVLPEVASSTLSVVVQVYGYLAFSAERYPAATGWVTGLTTPNF
jgi:HK97 family phage major capsid protein